MFLLCRRRPGSARPEARLFPEGGAGGGGPERQHPHRAADAQGQDTGHRLGGHQRGHRRAG